MLSPGEIYRADMTESHRRPVVVVSREELNRGSRVIVVQITSAHFPRRRVLPNCVEFRAGEFGLTKDCVATCENILSLDLTQIDATSGPIGVLDDERMRDLILALGWVLDADCEPN